MGHMPKECLQSYLQSVVFFISDLAGKYTKHAKKKQKARENCNLQGVVLSKLYIYIIIAVLLEAFKIFFMVLGHST